MFLEISKLKIHYVNKLQLTQKIEIKDFVLLITSLSENVTNGMPLEYC
jgi:hypothetical protein